MTNGFTNDVKSYGKVRYFLGAQVDVSGLLKDCSGLDSLRRLVEQRAQKRPDSVKPNGVTDKPDPLSAMKALCETFSPAELSLIFKKHEAPSEPEYKIHDTDRPPKTTDAGRVYIGDESESDSDETTEQSSHGEHAAFDPSSSTGNLGGVYKHVSIHDGEKSRADPDRPQTVHPRPTRTLVAHSLRLAESARTRIVADTLSPPNRRQSSHAERPRVRAECIQAGHRQGSLVEDRE